MQINPAQNRAFRYGDALFETIIYKNNELQLWDLHMERLQNGCRVLKFEANFLFEVDFLKIKVLQKVGKSQKDKRIRIYVWREDGGLYTPASNGINFTITTTDFKAQEYIPKISVGISKEVFLCYNKISMLKTTNSLLYILAGLEKTERNLEDLILLDTDGNLAEGSISNLFWEKDTIIYTPSIDCGCISGVKRASIIRHLKAKNIELKIGKYTLDELKESDGAILTNVAGIKIIECFENVKINTEPKLLLSVV